jgi:hypothetical protein
LDPDPDSEANPDPAIFVIDLQDANRKLIFCKSFSAVFLLLLFEGAFSSFFKDKKSKRSHRTVGNRGFLTIFA